MNWLARIGSRPLATGRMLGGVSALAAAAILQACRPGNWPRTTRNVLARQVLFTGVEALRFVVLAAILTGLAVVLQVHVWLARVGQTELVGPVVSALLIRELGPLLVNVVVIGRSGTAITTELANMRVHGEFNVLQAQGVDPFLYLVVPRVLAAALSIVGLATVFVAVSLIAATAFGILAGALTPAPTGFLINVLGGVAPADLANFFVKTVLSGVIIGAICVYEAAAIGGALTEVPQAGTRAVTRSIAAVLVLAALMSVLTYL